MTPNLNQHIEAVRRFNRFYTRQIGILDEGLLQSPFTLTEARIIYELAHHAQTTAAELGAELKLDAGYLSRILRDFEKRDLLIKQSSPTDGRQFNLSLSPAGESAFAILNSRSRQQIESLLAQHTPADQVRLVEAMHTIQSLLGSPPERRVPYILRPHQPGDMGWVVARHGVLYNREYGWNEEFEGLVAGIVAGFIQNYDSRRERCWIAERNGENVGSVFVVKQSDEVAKLRMLLVEPSARGLGIGVRLVDECLRFARQVGYRRMTLWTNSILTAARNIYIKAGFQLVASEPYHSFGHDLVSETWERDL